MPTEENFFDTVLEIVLEKDIPVLESQCIKSLFLTNRGVFRIYLTRYYSMCLINVLMSSQVNLFFIQKITINLTC